MKGYSKLGFTIIESMLFLAITGLMVMAIFIGSSSSINRQRYYDSVNTLQSIIQQQYAEVANIINNRDKNWQCDTTSGEIVQDLVDGEPRGQTECVILGKLVRSNDGKNLEINNIYGFMPSSEFGLNDVTVFGSSGYNIKVIDQGNSKYQVDWGVEISKKDDADSAHTFSLLILRSPISGNIKTFYNTEYKIDNEIQNLLVDSNITDGLLCLNPKGLFAGDKSAIKIEAGAFNGNGIKVTTEGGCE